jgi:hypothetical protein
MTTESEVERKNRRWSDGYIWCPALGSSDEETFGGIKMNYHKGAWVGYARASF